MTARCLQNDNNTKLSVHGCADSSSLCLIHLKSRKSLNYVGLISKIGYVSHSSLFVVKLIEGRKKISMPHLKTNFKLSPVKPFKERTKIVLEISFSPSRSK